MNWLIRFLIERRRIPRPASIAELAGPAPAPMPYVWYQVNGSIPHAAVYLVVDRDGRERSRHIGYLN